MPPFGSRKASTSAINIFGVGIERQQFLMVLVLAIVAVAVAYFFNRTDRGLAVLATSQDPMATQVVGIIVDPNDPSTLVAAPDVVDPSGGEFVRYGFAP